MEHKIKIIEFKPKFQRGVVVLIDEILKELKVIPDEEKLIDDEDLFKIPKVYSGKGRFWIAIVGNEVVGTVAIRDMGKGKAKLNRMFVKKQLRGTGLGQKLLNRALRYAKKQRFENILLNTHFLMKRAHRFYEKNGFKKTGKGEDKYYYSLALE